MATGRDPRIMNKKIFKAQKNAVCDPLACRGVLELLHKLRQRRPRFFDATSLFECVVDVSDRMQSARWLGKQCPCFY